MVMAGFRGPLSQASASLESNAAEIMLLRQNLSKTSTITRRATGMLTSFDDRLAKLEKSVQSIHKSQIGLSRVNTNIASLMLAIDVLLSHHDLVEKEEATISRGPRLSNLEAYKEAIDRLVAASEALKRAGAGSGGLSGLVGQKQDHDATVKRMNSTIEQGARQLGQVFLGYARESSHSPDDSVPTALRDKMSSLLSYLHGLPPNALGGLDKELQKTYGTIRETHMAGTLEILSAEAIENCKIGIHVGATTFSTVIVRFFTLAKAEHALASSIFPAYSANFIYKFIIPASLVVLVDTGTTINNNIKRSITTMVGTAFNIFTTLSEHVDLFDDWVRQKASRKENELGDLLHAFRGSCLRSLPEMIEEVKSWGSKPLTPQESASGGIGDMTKNVIGFMNHLCENQETAELLLQTLGDGNWVPFGTTSANRPQIDANQTLLEKYMGDLLSTLLAALDTRSRNMRQSRTNVGPIFLLNNISYLRREILSSSIDDLLGESAEDDLNKRNRTAKASYMELFSGLVGCLMDATSDQGLLKSAVSGAVGGEKRDVKDRFARFNDALLEVENVHRLARLDTGEEEMRERLHGEVEKMIMPTYGKFASRNSAAMTKTATKYSNLDVDSVQSRLAALFE